jgi:hypothetical protein
MRSERWSDFELRGEGGERILLELKDEAAIRDRPGTSG